MRNNIIIFASLLIFVSSTSFIPIINPGFETDCYPLDGTKGNGHVCWKDATGWNTFHDTQHTLMGHINPLGDRQFMNGHGSTEGIQCIFVSVEPQGFGTGEFGVEQTLSTHIMADTTYTLTVDIGNPFKFGREYHIGFPGARIYLLAQDIILKQENLYSLPDGEWKTLSLHYTVSSHDPYIGYPLGIRLVNLNTKYGDPTLNEILFDNVRLEAIAASANTCNCSAHAISILGMIITMFFLFVISCINMSWFYGEEVMKIVILVCDAVFYAHCNYYYNGDAVPDLYELNFKYDNIYICRICLCQFEKRYGNEDLLHCGHRYHKICLREWELQQLKQNLLRAYRCPICRTEYNWKQKWRY